MGGGGDGMFVSPLLGLLFVVAVVVLGVFVPVFVFMTVCMVPLGEFM